MIVTAWALYENAWYEYVYMGYDFGPAMHIHWLGIRSTRDVCRKSFKLESEYYCVIYLDCATKRTLDQSLSFNIRYIIIEFGWRREWQRIEDDEQQQSHKTQSFIYAHNHSQLKNYKDCLELLNLWAWHSFQFAHQKLTLIAYRRWCADNIWSD